MRIFKFDQFVVESRGLADPVLPYVKFIENLSLEAMNQLIESMKSFSKRMSFGKEDFGIREEEWKKLPVSTLDLEIKMDVGPEGDKPFYTTGLCFNMDEKDGSYLKEDGTVHLRVIIGVEIIRGLFTRADTEDLKVDLEAAVLHEMNHAYEGYNRKIKNYPPLQDAVTMATDFNTEDVPEKVWECWWRKLGYLIYYSEMQEVNAMVHDSIPYTKRFAPELMKLKNPTWEKMQEMIDFNWVDFKDEMNKLIEANMDVDPNELMTKMKNGLADKIGQLMSERGESNPSLSPSMIRKFTIDQFLKYIGKRINTRGKILRKKILKTYSN